MRPLRSPATYRTVRAALCAARARLGTRIVHYSIQADHIHLLVEAEDQIALGRAMKGFQVRVARRLNKLAGRAGRVFADRYHAHYLRSPGEVRAALVYVLQNGKKHAPAGELMQRSSRSWLDPFSSAAYFDGWSESSRRFVPARDAPALIRAGEAAPVVAPRVWLLRIGWKKGGGLIDTAEAPDVGRQRSSARSKCRR